MAYRRDILVTDVPDSVIGTYGVKEVNMRSRKAGGVWTGKFFGVDITQIGSGNLRTGGFTKVYLARGEFF